MAKRVKQRLGSMWWRPVEVAGWTVVAGGFVFFVYSLDAAIRDGKSAEQTLFSGLCAGVACFFGSALGRGARASGTPWRNKIGRAHAFTPIPVKTPKPAY